MKRLFSLLACVAVILSLSVPVFATGETDPENDPIITPDTTPEEPASEEPDPEEDYGGDPVYDRYLSYCGMGEYDDAIDTPFHAKRKQRLAAGHDDYPDQYP